MNETLKHALPGSLVDQYHIEKHLGEGGCGDVFLATDIKLAKKVAIKFVQVPPGQEQTSVHERFYREIQALVKINHPNVIQVFDYNMNGFEGPYYVMEYLQGQDLEACLQQRGPFSVAQVYAICQQLCSALHAIHEQDMVFRDLKTSNVFVVETSTYQHVKLLDFGLALSSQDERMTNKGFIVGTPFFMAPEQIMNTAKVDFRADIYSFGVMLFRLLTGEYPCQGSTRMEVLRQHCMGEPQLNHPVISADLQLFLASLLAKKPEERPSSMLAVWHRLEAVLVREMQRIGGETQSYIPAFREPTDVPEGESRTDMLSFATTSFFAPEPPGSWELTATPKEAIPGATGATKAADAAIEQTDESLLLEFASPGWWAKTS